MGKPVFLVNGKTSEQVNVRDRGLQYGHGLFETIAYRNKSLELWNAHIARLQTGCQRLFIPLPDIELLKTEALSLCQETDQGILKIVVTSGESERGYLTPKNVITNRILSFFPESNEQDYSALQNISVTLCNTRLAAQPALAGLKHLNRLEQILAREEWRGNNTAVYKEGILLDFEGSVISGTMSNLFFVKDNQLYTSDLANCGIQGVMRDFILGLANKMNHVVNIGQFTLQNVMDADEIFLTNSLIKIYAVKAIDSKSFSAPGPLTLKLWDRIAECTL